MQQPTVILTVRQQRTAGRLHAYTALDGCFYSCKLCSLL